MKKFNIPVAEFIVLSDADVIATSDSCDIHTCNSVTCPTNGCGTVTCLSFHCPDCENPICGIHQIN